MKRWCRVVRLLIVTMTLSSLLVMSGCEGTETRNQVDDSVEELAGKKQVERMKEMKEDLEHIQNQQTQHLDQLDDAQ